MITAMAAAMIFCGNILNIAVSDTNPYLPIDPSDSCIAKLTGGILYGKKVILKVDKARIRSCHNNVSGVKVTLNNEEVFILRFKSTNFLSAKTEDFKVDITDKLKSLRLGGRTNVKLKFEPIFIGENRDDDCFSFTARKFELYLSD